MKFPLKRFLSYYKPYRRLFVLDITCAILATAAALLFPQCVRYITGTLLSGDLPGVLPKIYQVGGVMVGLVIFSALTSYVYDAWGHAMGAMMERDMRREIFEKYQRLSFSFYDGQKPGALISRITTDLLTLTELYHHGPENLVIYGVKFLASLVILFTVNPGLTLIICAFLPPMAFCSLYFNKKLKAIFKRNLERIGDVNARVEENISGIRVVQAFGNEALETEKFDVENHRFLESRKTIYRHEAVFYEGIGLLSKCITIAAVVFGAVRIAGATLTLPDLMMVLMYVGYLTEPIPRLAQMTTQFQEGVAGFTRFMEIMSLQPEVRDQKDAVAVDRVSGRVTFENVGFRYGDTLPYVLSGLSLSVAAGEYVALVGPSGVGKTTLCSLIPRFYDVTEGRILLDGRDLRAITLSSLRSHIGVVQQEVYLFAGSVLENIRYGKPDAAPEEVMEAARRAHAHEFIEALPEGYQTDIGHRGVKLSGGQKQRLSIARVFLKNPPILILDEATSALDMESERVVQASLEALSQNRTTFVIAHRLSTVRNAGRILVLTDAGVAEQGTHDELMSKDGIYRRLYAEDEGLAARDA